MGAVRGAGEQEGMGRRRGACPFSLPGTEMSNMESPLGDDALPQVGEMPEREAKEELMLLEKEEERGSGREDAPREEGSVESLSALDEVAEDLKCPGEEDTVKLQGTPGGKICLCLLVRSTLNFNLAQVGGQWPWLKSRVRTAKGCLQLLCRWSFSSLRTLRVSAEAEDHRRVGDKRGRPCGKRSGIFISSLQMAVGVEGPAAGRGVVVGGQWWLLETDAQDKGHVKSCGEAPHSSSFILPSSLLAGHATGQTHLHP